MRVGIEDARPLAVEFTANSLVLRLADGRTIATPIAWYPRLASATPAQRVNVELSALGVHWPDLDEDLSVAGMLAGRPAVR